VKATATESRGRDSNGDHLHRVRHRRLSSLRFATKEVCRTRVSRPLPPAALKATTSLTIRNVLFFFSHICPSNEEARSSFRKRNAARETALPRRTARYAQQLRNFRLCVIVNIPQRHNLHSARRQFRKRFDEPPVRARSAHWRHRWKSAPQACEVGCQHFSPLARIVSNERCTAAL